MERRREQTDKDHERRHEEMGKGYSVELLRTNRRDRRIAGSKGSIPLPISGDISGGLISYLSSFDTRSSLPFPGLDGFAIQRMICWSVCQSASFWPFGRSYLCHWQELRVGIRVPSIPAL